MKIISVSTKISAHIDVALLFDLPVSRPTIVINLEKRWQIGLSRIWIPLERRTLGKEVLSK